MEKWVRVWPEELVAEWIEEWLRLWHESHVEAILTEAAGFRCSRSKWNGGAVLRLWRCLRGREEAGARAAELGGVLGRGLGEEGGEGRVRRRLGVDLIVEWRGAGACLSALGCVEAGARR